MRILIACEESQRVCIEFRRLGFEAFSCDLLSTSGDFPEFHIQGNVLDIINHGWDAMIGFPPCTFLSNAGACNFRRHGMLNLDRFYKMQEGRDFFMELLNCSIKFIALENPKPISYARLPKQDQIIQPWYFGDPYSKATYLWLKNLPPLLPDDIVEPIYSCADDWYMKGGKERQKNRSKTFPGVARAMAHQWGEFLINNS